MNCFVVFVVEKKCNCSDLRTSQGKMFCKYHEVGFLQVDCFAARVGPR